VNTERFLTISHASDIPPGIVETLLHLRFRIDVGVLPPWCVIPAPTLLVSKVITPKKNTLATTYAIIVERFTIKLKMIGYIVKIVDFLLSIVVIHR
jgi:hypothetical protein